MSYTIRCSIIDREEEGILIVILDAENKDAVEAVMKDIATQLIDKALFDGFEGHIVSDNLIDIKNANLEKNKVYLNFALFFSSKDRKNDFKNFLRMLS